MSGAALMRMTVASVLRVVVMGCAMSERVFGFVVAIRVLPRFVLVAVMVFPVPIDVHVWAVAAGMVVHHNRGARHQGKRKREQQDDGQSADTSMPQSASHPSSHSGHARRVPHGAADVIRSGRMSWRKTGLHIDAYGTP